MWWSDNAGVTTTVNFVNGSGWRLQSDGWYPVAAPMDAETVIETIDAVIDGTSHDNIASEMQDLDLLRYRAPRYLTDQTQDFAVWLVAQMDSETGSRRAVVTNIDMEILDPLLEEGTGWQAENTVRIRLKVTRLPWWEDQTTTTLLGVSCWVLNFDSGSTIITPGETLTGAVSGHVTTVYGVNTRSGSYVGGDAAGTFYCAGATGTFNDNEALNGSIAGDDCATLDGTRSVPLGYAYDYTGSGDIVGDIPARIQYQIFEPAVSSEVGRIWAGIRSNNKVPNPEYYCCVWEMEYGTQEDADCATETEAGGLASPQNGTGVDYIKIDYDRGGGSATDWDDGDFHEAWSWTLDDMMLGGVEKDCRNAAGDLLLLMRAAPNPSGGQVTTWEVQLRVGTAQMADADFLELWKVEMSSDTVSTKWEIYEMGVVRLPLHNVRALKNAFADMSVAIASTQFQIWARRTSTALGDLDIDCVMPIPLDEGYLIIKDAVADATTSEIWFGQGPLPKDRQVGIYDSTNKLEQIVMARSANFALPPGDGRLIFCNARDSLSVISDRIIVNANSNGKIYERWANLRGAE
jgi:hypothetical protein